MANVTVYNMEGREVGTMELSDAVFGAPINEHLLHLAVVRQLANKRQGTQKAKGRSEVSGGGRKPWRQKGTGHARQGSIRAAQWKGGGMIWAPTPRDYSVKMNKKEVRAALRSALTSKVQDNKCIVLDNLALSEIKTKEMQKVLNNLKAENIPLAARILRVCDAFGALIANRSYLEAFDIERAFSIMIEEVKYFDMHVFLTFQKVSQSKEIEKMLRDMGID